MPTVSIDGVDLFYVERGGGSPVLMVHGMGGDADVWGETVDLLAEDHRVITYDRRGFTRSKHPPVGDMQRHREDAAALLRALDATPATVVGWSSGGIIALDLAIHDPELVAALALQEPPLHLKRRPRGLRQMRAAITAQLLSRLKDDRAASEAFFRWAFRYASGGTGYDRLPDALREAMLDNGEANVAELAVATGEHLSKEQIAEIACPVVCVAGELSDRAFSRVTDYMVRLIPGAKVETITGAAHTMHLQRPAEFAAAVRTVVPGF